MTAELDDIFYYKGELMKVVGINTGYKSIIFEPVSGEKCPCCHEKKQYNVIEQSADFQGNAKPVSTITE